MLALLLLGSFLRIDARAEPVPIGINIVNPGRLSEAHQTELLDQIVAAKVSTVRIPLSSKADRSGAVRFVEAAASRNLRILLIVDLDFLSSAPIRSADSRYPQLWSAHPLSAADAALFKNDFGAQLAAFEAKGIKFVGFELGNEINWAAFNGEFTIPGEQKVLSIDDLTNDLEGRKIANGYRSYVETLKSLRAIRDNSRLNRQTPIITAGLADPGVAGPRSGSPADAVTIAATIAYFQSYGVDKIADAIGIHSYLPVEDGTTPDRYASQLRNGPFSLCSKKLNCWVTEWGLKNTNTQCPTNDSDRAEKTLIARQGYEKLIADGSVKGMFYFAWNTDPWSTTLDPLSVYRCGALTQSGQIATAQSKTIDSEDQRR